MTISVWRGYFDYSNNMPFCFSDWRSMFCNKVMRVFNPIHESCRFQSTDKTDQTRFYCKPQVIFKWLNRKLWSTILPEFSGRNFVICLFSLLLNFLIMNVKSIFRCCEIKSRYWELWLFPFAAFLMMWFSLLIYSVLPLGMRYYN